nr:cation-translocating P-type ATPase [uncultured Dethiosulfovibrio sp.]
MAHDFARRIVDGDRCWRGSRLFFGIGGSLLASSIISLWIYGESLHSSMVAMAAAVFMGTPLLWHAVGDLLKGSSEMNELAALGVLATFASGQFLTSALISFVMLLAAMLENRSAKGARDSLEVLMDLRPRTAWALRGREWEEVPVEDLNGGDEVKVRPGEGFPVDGVVLDGRSTVNQATITGESMPADKGPGDPVYAGTVNLTGVLVCQVTSVGKETTLGKVQDLIAQAECTKTPVMRIIDRYARWYVPTIMVLAGATLFVTRDLSRAVAMVVVACPCSILLSGPTAIVASLASAARMGILIKDVAHLEIAEKLTAMVFDKTGTVTTGELQVVEIEPSPEWSWSDLLALACGVERDSCHPVAMSLQRKAGEAGIDIPLSSSVIEHHGKGVQGEVEGKTVLVGRIKWLEDLGVSVPDALGTFPGRSLLGVAVNRSWAGQIAMEDGIKPELVEAMRNLDDYGIERKILLSGDRESVVRRVGGIMEISECFWDMLPQDKMEYVRSMIDRGDIVGVVGDGVNDGPALSAGHLAIAMGAAGSDVAISSASIALMNDDIRKVPEVLGLARETLRVIRQNLRIAFGSIGLSMILGALGVIHPAAAAVLHGVTSLTVVLNSAKLMKYPGGV